MWYHNRKRTERRSYVKKLKALFIALTVAFSFLIISFGYAVIEGAISLEGSAEAKAPPFQGVYIFSVEVASTSGGVSSSGFEIIKPTNLSTTIKVPASNGTITYKVTVHNNTDVTYWFLGTVVPDNYANNSLIGKANGIFITPKDHESDLNVTFDTGDWVPAGEMRTFYVTYRFGNSAMGTMSTVVNFKFGLQMDAVQDDFLRILNDKTSSNGYNYLTDVFDEKYSKSGTTVIGNIGADDAIFDKLFGKDLYVTVDGVSKPVTVMIERRNVDGNASSGDSYGGGGPSGCEYTVYITTDSLDGGTPTVYAVSYTCGADGVWRQLGELYEGTCSTANYDSAGNKCISVSTWDATAKEYKVTNNISYKVGYEQGDQYDKLDSIDELFSTKDQDFYNDINNNSEKLLKPVCQLLYTYRHNNGKYDESENVNNKYKPGYDELKRAFDALKPHCYIGNGAQEVKIQNASSMTRAELIQYLEAIQHAYDYYLSVN